MAGALTLAGELTIYDNVRRTGELLKSGLQQLTQKYPGVVQTARGLGMMLGVELAANIPNLPGDPTKTQSARMTNLLHAAGLEISKPGGRAIAGWLEE